MPREVRVLAIEDRPWWVQPPLFSFPFIGDLSVRQLLIVMTVLVPSIAIVCSLGLSFLESIVIIISALFVGLGIAKKPVKSVLPEKQLALILMGKCRPRRTVANRPTRKEAHQVPETVDIVARDPSKIPTIKVAGVLRDPLGNPLANTLLEVYVNNRKYTTIRTGSSGEYLFYFTPDGPGLYEITIHLEGKPILRRRIRVGVRG